MSSKSLANAEAALKQLLQFLEVPAISDRDRAGVIQAFEFTFEAAWKLLKHLAEAEGLAAESPKRALLAAFKIGIVTDEALWLEMLRDRNLSSHVYHVDLAERIFTAIRDRYAAALEETIKLARTALAE
jgi:nucleotidyltransferase substrate binding protein (TIGR01987 family)